MRNVIFILMFISVPLFATNYYISNTGDDSQAGTSPETAWKTILKVEGQTYNGGDSILFQKGGLWRYNNVSTISGTGAMISVTESGTSESYITYSSYGTGNIPKIYGSVVRSNFENISGNLYRCTDTIKYDPYNLPVSGGTIYHSAIWFRMNDTTVWADTSYYVEDLDANLEWDWRNDTLYFYYDGLITDIDSIEIPQYSRAFDLIGNYICVDGFELKYFFGSCVSTSTWPETTVYGAIVRNCELAYTNKRMTADTSTNVGYGVNLHHADMTIEGNIAHDNGRRNLSFNVTNATGTCIMRNVIIQNNILFNGFHTAGIDMATQGANHQYKNIIVRNNKIYEPNIDKNQYAITMNFFENNASTWDSLWFYNNAIINAATGGVMLYGVGTVWVMNNTFVAAPYDRSGSFAAVAITGTSAKATVMNNIFFVHNTSAIGYTCIQGQSSNRDAVTWDTVDYNYVYIGNSANHYIAYPPSSWAQLTYDYPEWSEIQGYGWEVNTLTPPQYPCFVDSLGSYEIKSSSPAIGAGKPVSFITTDIDGNPRTSTNDAGAYQYTASEPEPEPEPTPVYLIKSSDGNMVMQDGVIIIE